MGRLRYEYSNRVDSYRESAQPVPPHAGNFMGLFATIFALFNLVSFKLTAQIGDATKIGRPKTFELTFAKSSTVEADPYYKFSVEDLGKLKIISGKLVLSNVDGIGKTASFRQNFPKGNFTVQIALGKDPADTSTFLAYGRIVFSNEPVIKWEYALKPGENYRSLNDTSFVRPLQTCGTRKP